MRVSGVSGDPEAEKISASYAERNNLTMRMEKRRMTRFTNDVLTEAREPAHAVALHVMYYNLGRIHQTLCITRAMAAAVMDRPNARRDRGSRGVKLTHYPLRSVS